MTLDSEYTDWQKIPAGTFTQDLLPFPKEIEPYHRMLWPAGNPYVSPLNPIFVTQLVALSQLNQREHWLIRDGIVPLAHFFRAHPTPVGLTAKIYVEESVAMIVPAAWKDHAGTYQIVSKKPQGRIERLIICGIGMRCFQSAQELDHQLAAIGQRALRKLPVEIFLPLKGGDAERQDFPFEYFSVLHKWLGTARHLSTWADFSLRSSFEGYELIELSNKRLCADSYYAQVILSKGGYMRGPRTTGGEEVPLSPFHGYVLKDKIPRAVQNKKIPPLTNQGDFPYAEWFQKWKNFAPAP